MLLTDNRMLTDRLGSAMCAELTGKINSYLKHAEKCGFSNKTQSVETIAKESDETLFFKMQCKQHSLNPTLPPLKPNIQFMASVPREHSYELQSINQFNSNFAAREPDSK